MRSDRSPRCLPVRLVLAAVGAGSIVTSTAQAQEFLLGPPDPHQPTVVAFGFYLTDVVEVDEGSETFAFEGVLTLKWRDDRQAFDPAEAGVSERIYQGSYQFSEVFTGWWPQLVLANESGNYNRQGMLLRVRPDGSITYIEEMDAVAEVRMSLRRFPFDRQEFEAVFEVLGFDKSEVILVPDAATTGSEELGVNVAQWRLTGIDVTTREYDPAYGDGHAGELSAAVVSIGVARKPGFMLRVIVVPLMLLVMLSWSVFWMDRESLGTRMDISFIGILTVVAFQIVVSDSLPRIAYFTLMSSFLYLNYLLLFGSVVVNLTVGGLDRAGKTALGDRLDRACRWIFPLSYFGSNGLAALYFLGFE